MTKDLIIGIFIGIIGILGIFFLFDILISFIEWDISYMFKFLRENPKIFRFIVIAGAFWGIMIGITKGVRDDI